MPGAYWIAHVTVLDLDARKLDAIDTEYHGRVATQMASSATIGQAVATPGCGLPCRYIIHVAGPGWYGGEPRERFLLAGCYQNALHKAYLCSCRRVAVPLIFSGDCHMPRAASLR